MTDDKKINELLSSVDGKLEHLNVIFCKKYKGERELSYSFVKPNLSDEAAKQFFDMLSKNVERLTEKIGETSYSMDNTEINLENVNHWNKFREKMVSNRDSSSLDRRFEKLSVHLTAFLVYVKVNNDLLGYARRLHPSSVLKSGILRMFIEGESISKVSEQKVLEIDENCDFVFIEYNDLKKGYKLNEDNFDQIFEMPEKYQAKAKENLNRLPGLASIPNAEKLKSVVLGDKGLQKRLSTPFIQKGIDKLSTDDIKKIISEVSASVTLSIVLKNDGSLMFDEGNIKKAISDYLDIVGYKYSKPFVQDYIIRSTPEKLINTGKKTSSTTVP